MKDEITISSIDDHSDILDLKSLHEGSETSFSKRQKSMPVSIHL